VRFQRPRATAVRRVLRWTRALLVLVVAATLLDVAPVRAQDEAAVEAPEALAGYQGSAAATGLHAFYNPSGLLPIPPPVDLGAPDALATIASGPATFARASVLDPGDLLASPDALLALFSADWPAGTIPPYPYRIAASSGVGQPSVDLSPAPGLTARVEVGDGTSAAKASIGAAEAPAIVTVGPMSASATTRTDGDEVTVRAVSKVAGFDLLGLLHIDGITTDLTATSSGGTTELRGGTKLVGASMLGQPITIDERGVHPAPGASPLLGGLLQPLVGGLNGALKAAGITISMVGPVELQGAKEGQLASTGLRIDVELSRDTQPALAQLLDAIPPIENPLPGAPSIEDLLVAVQARHLASIEVGRAVVSLAARTSGAVDTDSSVALPDDSGSFDVPPSGDSFDLAPTGPTPAPSAVQPAGTTQRSTVPKGAGVGALVLLALLAVPFVGERLAWLCSTVLAAGGGERCNWEGS
jgi:hypothetical protein